ncbi:MAG: pit accessory protein [Verrucomicrobia subdivision 3 bacterium]|nr:pit accessory protein [Limisphaerales bacterium]
MFSFRQLLGKEDKFFTLLEASAEEARACVRTLGKYLQSPGALKNLDEFILARRKDKAITAQISEALCTTFVTALEREDIEALSNALYKIPKTVEKIAERIMLGPQHLEGTDLKRQMALLERATDTVVLMIQELRRGVHLERIRSHNDQLQAIEGDADETLLAMLKILYASHGSAIRIVFLKDLFELLEKVADRCRDAGNVINHIVLKNS